MATVATVCGYCGVGCGMDLHVAGGVVTKATGRADHPANRGRLCTKGNTTADMLRAGGRLDKALRRPQRGAEAEPVAVDTAIAEVAARLSAIRDEHGPDAIALYVSGQMTTEAQYLANKLAKGYLRTQWIESNSRLCMASAGTGYKQSLGADGPPGSYDDLDTADLFLVLGANMADCHPILYLRMMDRARNGAKLVVVDPRRTATAAKADLHLPIRPGTDLALLNGLLRLVRDAGGVDTDFVAAYTDGWEPLDALLDEYPADLVADITGLDEADLRTVAELICGTKNWVSLWTMGLNQSTHGTWNTNALCNLHLATGAICRPGAGPFSLTGQPNAMGGREMGYMGPGLPGQRSALDPDDRAFVEARWGLDPGTIRAEGGTGTVDMYRRMADGEIRAAWIICTNPVASVANRSSVIAGLQRADLVVVQEAFAGAETAEYADVVLPAALWAEADGVMVNSERTLTHCGAAMDPPGDAAPDWQLICRVATAMGYQGFEFDSAADVFDELAGFHNPRTGWDLRGVDHERLRRGPVQWPAAPGGDDRNPIRYRNDGVSQDLHTADDGTVPALVFPDPEPARPIPAAAPSPRGRAARRRLSDGVHHRQAGAPVAHDDQNWARRQAQQTQPRTVPSVAPRGRRTGSEYATATGSRSVPVVAESYFRRLSTMRYARACASRRCIGPTPSGPTSPSMPSPTMRSTPTRCSPSSRSAQSPSPRSKAVLLQPNSLPGKRVRRSTHSPLCWTPYPRRRCSPQTNDCSCPA